MQRLYRAAGIILVAIAVTEPAQACVPPPPPIQLPNETESAYRARAKEMVRATEYESRRRFQSMLYDSAQHISLAIVMQSRPVDEAGLQGHEVVVRQVAKIKSTPSESVTLTDRYLTSCGPVGGGPATAESPGNYVLLFENAMLNREHTDYGIPLKDVGEPGILESINQLALHLRDSADGSAEQ